MMKYWIIFSVLVISNYAGYSQIGSLGIEFNYNNYSLGNIKTFQKEILNQLPVPAKVTHNFPPYFGIKGKYSNIIKNYKFSVFFGFNSTGGRISYYDYSGKIVIDQILDIYSLGLQWDAPLYKKKNYFLYFTPKCVFAFTNFQFKQKFEVYSETEEDKMDLRSSSGGLGIGLKSIKKINFIEITAEVGYDYLFPSKIYLAGHKDYFLIDQHGSNVKCELNGWRTSIGFFFDLDYIINQN